MVIDQSVHCVTGDRLCAGWWYWPKCSLCDLVASDQSVHCQVASDQVASNQSAHCQVASDQVAFDQVASDQVASDQSVHCQVASDQVASDQVASNQMVHCQVASGQVASQTKCPLTKWQVLGQVVKEVYCT